MLGLKSKKKCERKTVDDFEGDYSVESGRNKAGRMSKSMAKSREDYRHKKDDLYRKHGGVIIE